MRGVLDQLHQKGAELYVIGNGAPHFAKAFQKDTGFDGKLYTDPSLETYRAAEMKKSFGSTLNLKVLKKGYEAFRQGFMQTRTRGNPWQLGGVVIVRDGHVLYRQASEHAGDHPPVEELLAAVAG